MAFNGPQPVKWTFEASADLSASFGKFVKLNAAGQVAPVTATTDRVIGVLCNKPKTAGAQAEVVILGITKMIASADLAIGDSLGTSADGRAAATATTAGTANVGTVLADNSAANGWVSVTLNCLNQTR